METVKIRELRGAALRERARSGEPLAITNRGALTGVIIPVTQSWVEHLIDYNWSHVRESIDEGEQAMADGLPMVTLDAVVGSGARGDDREEGPRVPERLAVPLVAAIAGGTVIQPPETREALERLRAMLWPGGTAGEQGDPPVATIRVGELSAERIEQAGAGGQVLALTHDRELIGIVIPVTQGLVQFLIEQNMSRVLYSIGLGEKQLQDPGPMTTLDQVMDRGRTAALPGPGRAPGLSEEAGVS
jgi:antitoxin (DNA-binding transcriptional repressor) of toxin-antitoxin stability system